VRLDSWSVRALALAAVLALVTLGAVLYALHAGPRSRAETQDSAPVADAPDGPGLVRPGPIAPTPIAPHPVSPGPIAPPSRSPEARGEAGARAEQVRERCDEVLRAYPEAGRIDSITCGADGCRVVIEAETLAAATPALERLQEPESGLAALGGLMVLESPVLIGPEGASGPWRVAFTLTPPQP
jgi:hypothetical protein